MSELTLGGRLRLLRTAKSLSQDDLAKLLGSHKNTIVRYESDERMPDTTFLIHLCSTFQISPKWVLYGDGPMYEHLPTEAEIRSQFGRTKFDGSGEGGPLTVEETINALLMNRQGQRKSKDHELMARIGQFLRSAGGSERKIIDCLLDCLTNPTPLRQLELIKRLARYEVSRTNNPSEKKET